MIKLKNILLEDRLDAMKDRLKLSDDDVLYLKSLNVPDKYIIWLANQYKLSIKEHGSNRIFKEDAYKYKEALQKFLELSNKNKIENKNINNYKDIFALYNVINQFDDIKSKRELEKDIKLEGADKIFENDKWLVVIPKTEEAACYYGRGTKWCTAATKSHNQFDDYNKYGPLYIFINKKNSNQRYQYWFYEDGLESVMYFNDINDSDYPLSKFKKNNPSLTKILDRILNNLIKNLNYKIDNKIIVSDDEFNLLSSEYKQKQLVNKILSYKLNGNEYKLLSDDNKRLYALTTIEGSSGRNILSDDELRYLKPHEIELYKMDEHHHAIRFVIRHLIYDENTKEYNSNKSIIVPRELVKNGKFAIKFGHIKGSFFCEDLGLESLDGSPHTVDKSFSCINNKLTTLDGLPKSIGDSFYCSRNTLKTLNGSPQIINETFNCSQNHLKTLEGGPQTVKGNFYCSYNDLETLKGGPQTVGGHMDFSKNKLKSLEGFPEIINGDLILYGNEFESLKGFPKIINGDLKVTSFSNIELSDIPKITVNGDFYYKRDFGGRTRHSEMLMRKYIDIKGEFKTIL